MLYIIIGAALVLPGIRKDRETELSRRAQKREKGKKTPLRYPAWVGLYASYVSIGVINTIFPVSARDDLSLGKTVIGSLLLFRSLFMTGGFIILGRTSFWHFKKSPMVPGQLSLAIIFILMVYLRSPLLLGPILAVMGLAGAMSYSTSIFHGVSDTANRAARMGIHEVLVSAGFINGSSIGGVLYQRYSMPVVYWFCSGLVLAGVVVQIGLALGVGRLTSAKLTLCQKK